MPETDVNTEDGKTQRYLDAEDAARRLATSLTQLDEETARYDAAATNLTEAADATKALTSAVAEVGSAALESVQVVASVGGPEIVAQVEAHGATLSSIESRLESVGNRAEKIERDVRQADERVGSIEPRLESLEKLAADTDLGVKQANDRALELAGRVNLVLYVSVAAVVTGIASMLVSLLQ